MRTDRALHSVRAAVCGVRLDVTEPLGTRHRACITCRGASGPIPRILFPEILVVMVGRVL